MPPTPPLLGPGRAVAAGPRASAHPRCGHCPDDALDDAELISARAALAQGRWQAARSLLLHTGEDWDRRGHRVTVLAAEPYAAERDVYPRLAENNVWEVLGHAIPLMIAWSNKLLVIEMTIVSPPYLLDFAKKPRWSYVMGIELEGMLDTYEAYGGDSIMRYLEAYPAKVYPAKTRGNKKSASKASAQKKEEDVIELD